MKNSPQSTGSVYLRTNRFQQPATDIPSEVSYQWLTAVEGFLGAYRTFLYDLSDVLGHHWSPRLGSALQ